MVSILRYIFFFSLIFLLGCKKAEFTLNFNLEKDVTENYNVTYYAAAIKGGLTVQSVASVREGKCLLKGTTVLPTMVDIFTRRSSFPLVLIASKGSEIKISGEGNDPLGWNVEGDKINEELSAWRLENLHSLRENETDSVNQAVRNFVEGNRENPVSTILMLCYYNREADENGYSELMASLKGEARNEQWLHILARTDQLLHHYSYPAGLESLVMRSMKEGADTLTADSKNPIFLLIWQSGYSDKNNMVDSIKALGKEYPDSVRIIADIFADIDSVAWKNAIRRDSLDFIKRFWAPLSLADPTLQKLKVKGLPYFIVFSPDGAQSYRGTDLSEAMTRYRRLLDGEEEDSVTNL
ncbi:MAG: DUF4369 domain-containing protein [Muribaculaceae bacterium]|nr:DUF4369 domain-containing protein [Muribaculaceae bacterium]